MTTEIGKELRKLRIDREERLLDMARYLGKSSSFVSAVEVGKKSPPSGFEELVIKAYNLADQAAEKMRQAADQSRTAFTIKPSSARGRDTAGLLARRMNKLSEKELEEIHHILQRGRSK